MRKLLSCRDYDGLDIWRKAAVRISDGALCLEVYHIADSAHDVAYSKLMASVDCQIVIFYDADALQALDSLTYDGNALVHVEEAALVLVDADSDDDFVEHCQCPFKNIEMSRGKRIEGSREQCFNFHYDNNYSSANIIIASRWEFSLPNGGFHLSWKNACSRRMRREPEEMGAPLPERNAWTYQ